MSRKKSNKEEQGRNRFRRFLSNLLLYLGIFSAVMLVLSYLATHVPPEKFWPLAFAGLAFPFILIVNIFFLLYWAIRLNKYALIPFLAIILGFNHLSDSFSVFPSGRKTERDEQTSTLKVMSYNVRAFNLYRWLNDPETNKGILNFIRSENPDIICLQEFYTEKSLSGGKTSLEKLFENTPYKHVHFIQSKPRGGGYGIATFSRYPVVKTGRIEFNGSNNTCIYTDIAYQSDTIRVYNTHLQSVHFHNKNLSVINQMIFPNQEEEIREIREIGSKLKNAFIKRGRQADLVSAHIGKSVHPVIVCGDFNDTPVSYTYRTMMHKLSDAFVEAGRGLGLTYHGRISFRIDYILYSDEFKALEFEKVEAHLSDHFPIMTELRF